MLAGIMEGARHRYRVQTPESVRTWGLLVGDSFIEATRRMQPPELAASIIGAADMAMDTRESQLVLVPFGGGLGKVLMVPDEGSLFARWDWIEEPRPVLTLAQEMRLMSEHLHRLAWALREGRPLPHLPRSLAPSTPAARPSEPSAHP